MSRQLSALAHLWDLPARKFWVVSAAVLALVVPAVAQDDSAVMRVEEDWKLVLNEPNSLQDCPQFHTIMSAYHDLDTFYAQVIWNYRGEESYEPGGLEFQTWVDNELDQALDLRTEPLSTSAETITWTQVLKAHGNGVSFYIINGQSTTWGQFGEYLIDSHAGVHDLNEYDTNTSVHNSWITYGANRVDSLTITEVRRYNKHDDLMSVDDAPKSVFQIEDLQSQ